MRRLVQLLTLVIAISLGATASFAQNGRLKIKVIPKKAYVFVDGNAIREGSQTIPLSPGKHTVVVANYGYKISSQDVNIDANKTTPLTVNLDAQGAPVNGPFGQIEIKGDSHAAVLLNGTTPPYFVGHVGATNHDWWWHRNLFVPPGTYHATVTRNGTNVWTGDINVVANQKVSIDTTKNGAMKTKNKPNIAKLANQTRYKGGWISDRVAVAGVTGSFNSSTANINCGQSATLNWQTGETAGANISGVGPVPATGSQTVSPHATTTYDFNSSGPGGTVKGSTTVNVNTKVDASLTANPTEAHYRKIGDKVITQDSSTLTWQTSNADSVTFDGKTVAASGSDTVKAEPADSSAVAEGGQARTIDENKTYTLNATNVCGGSSTQTASLHVTGSVEPIPAVTLQSIFYPTDYPDKRHPQVGLVRSQQLALATLAGGFKKYVEYDPDAKLSVEAYADDRGSKPYNQDLSERRVERIKQYLVGQGIASDKIQTAAYGKERPLDRGTVATLESSNPNTPPKARMKDRQTNWLAYNRRADIVLLPAGKKSAQFFPHTADDSKLIWQMSKPPLTKVEADQ